MSTGPLPPRAVVELAFLTARRLVDAASAEDVAQETWVKYRTQLAKEGAAWIEARARAWVRCVAANGARGLLRKRRPEETEAEPVASEAADPAAAAEQAEQQALDADLARRVLAELPADERRLIALRVLEGLSWGEVAQVLDERPSTLRARFTRLRQRIQQRWGEGEA